MASEAAIRAVLDILASNYFRKEESAEKWLDRTLLTCRMSPAVKNASDASLRDACLRHMETSQYAPKLCEIVAQIQGGRTHGGGAANGHYCEDCGGTGWREGIAHVQVGDDVTIDGPWALACGCLPRPGKSAAAWLNEMDVRPNVLGWWLTGRNLRALPEEARLTPLQRQRMADLRAQKGGGKVLAFRLDAADPHARERARHLRAVGDQ